MNAKTYIETHKDRFLEDLYGLIRIPSISADPVKHKDDMVKAANYWKEHLLSLGVDKAEVYPTEGNPVVVAEKIIDPKAKTILVYGHYDVMPVEPLELWHSDPFEPEIRDGHLWARGADDDKGQSMIQAKGFETAMALGYVKCNVKFIFEGEEEIGSTHLEAFMQSHKELLKADAIIVSDTGMVAADIPSLTTGLRGLCYWDVEVTGPNRDLHSGQYGGAVANPINELCKLIASMTDEKGKITIPHFYDDVVELTPAEREMIAAVPFSEEEYCKQLDIEATYGEEGYTTTERHSCRPSFDVCGIWGGHTGEGSKTVLPSKAYAKVSSRLVANQDHHKIAKLFAEHFEKIAPKYIKVKVTPSHGGAAYLCPTDFPVYQAAEKAYEAVFGKRPLAVRSGGSIPIIATFERVLGVKTVLMGFGLGSNAIHSPNENFPIDIFYKGIETVVEFYRIFE